MKGKAISVIIPTYNPHPQRLEKVLLALSNQTLDTSKWELIIIDNNSNNNILEKRSAQNGLSLRIVKEKRQGLTWARLKGFSEAKGDLIVMVDDDNILAPSYLEMILEEFEQNPRLGAVGGKSIAQFESPELPPYYDEIKEMLAIRDLGEQKVYYELPQNESLTSYPPNSPIGAGMGIRKAALSKYLEEAANKQIMASDRQGDKLSSGGDNDIVLSILKNGFGVLYSPQLSLLHIIPSSRLKPDYLAKMNHDSSKSWVEVLAKHGISPWKPAQKWTLPFRKFRSYIRMKAWQSDLHYIRWRGACGVFEGRSTIS